MKLDRRWAVLALLAAALNTSLAIAQDDPDPNQGAGPPAAALEAAQNSNAFGFDLYRQLAKSEQGNLFFSPYSISAAMGMAYEGARGETRAQIKRVLHFGDDVAAGQGQLDTALTRRIRCPQSCLDTQGAEEDDQGGMAQALKPSAPQGQAGQSQPAGHATGEEQGGGPMLSFDEFLAAQEAAQDFKPTPNHTIRVANRAWPQVGFPIKDSYLEALKPYRVGIEPLDFASAPEAAKDTINAWVAERTQNQAGEPMIPELLASLKPTTRLVLTNAVYFRGEWQTAFDPAQTRKAPFHRADGSMALVDMMNATGVDVPVGAIPGQGYVWVMPYRAHGADLVIALPMENTPASMAALEAGLSPESIEAALAPGHVMAKQDLAFPKFAIDGELQLADALQAMGVTDAFSSAAADLRGIAEGANGGNVLHIDKVVHKATASFTEEGAEAAAATAVVVGLESAVLGLRVDRPFVFLIRDTKTGAVLFMGRVMDPTQ